LKKHRKMKTKSILLFLLITSFTFAQKPVLLKDFKFEIGQKYKRIKNMGNYLVAAGDRVVSIKKIRNSMIIQRFSLDKMVEDIKQRQEIEDKGDFESVMQLGDYAVVFYSSKNKAYGQRISPKGIIAKKPILLVNDKEKIAKDFGFKSTYGFDAGGRINQFAFKKSPNGKKMVAVFRIKTANEKADKIGIMVFSDGLNLIWRRKVTMPYSSDILQNEDFAIDNFGNFFMTASVFSEATTKKDKLETSFRTEVFKITEEGEEIIKSKINLPERSITDAVIEFDDKNNARVSGFYASNMNKTEISGVFSATVIDNGTVGKVAKSEIPTAMIDSLASQRETRIAQGTQKKDDLLDLERIRVNDVIFNPDGSTVLLGEQRFVDVFTTSSSSGSRTTYKYYYRDIFAFKISNDGKMLWNHKLPKWQMGTVGKRSMSYINFENEGKHYMFYMDDFTNLKRSLQETPTRYFDGKKEFIYLTAYVVDDATGAVSKEAILTGSDLRNARLDAMWLSKHGGLPNKDMVFEIFDGKKNNLLFKISLAK